MTVTPVRTGPLPTTSGPSPAMSVVWPTRTPATSVIALKGPRGSPPIAIPRSDARTPLLAAPHSQAGLLRKNPAAVVRRREACVRVVREKQVAVEIDPVRERRDDRRRGNSDGRFLHAAEERLEAEQSGALQHPFCRTHATAFG